ncbi:hypothetical protein [Priestia megaterium]|uniref:hypothetical protein n=1 Tax=Priestia megaterium TaxID=1404 RepID=UPI000E2F35E6|nr:hypothetical protein [Priestia megaterium]MDN3232771.1 hypothetical protein [Priestia megaterium]RFB19436.1 hypothetical protein DZB87_29130 [Bacillus sp. ALD]
MDKKLVSYIIFLLWFIVLFFLWVIITLLEGTSGQWWSIYRLIPEEYGPWALDVSEVKVIVAGIIFLLVAYLMTLLSKRKR